MIILDRQDYFNTKKPTSWRLNPIGRFFLFHDFFQQCLIAVHNTINDIIRANRLEMRFCTVDFSLFCGRNMIELHRIQCAFCFGNKVDVFHAALIKSDCPVWVIPSHRCRNIESSWLVWGGFVLWCQSP